MLNPKQSDKIADFLFDIAKGLILGGIQRLLFLQF